MKTVIGDAGRIVALATCLGLAACAAQDGSWIRDGLTSIKLGQDQRECSKQAGSYAFLSQDTTVRAGASGVDGVDSRAGARRQADLHRLCMNARGYKKKRPGATVSHATQQ